MPVESSLEKLVKDSVKPGVVPVKKYEYDEKENTVVMYFNDMPKEKSCWTFQTKRDNAVGDLQVGSNSHFFIKRRHTHPGSNSVAVGCNLVGFFVHYGLSFGSQCWSVMKCVMN